MAKTLRHKFGAMRCEHDGMKFDSKKERNRYLELKTLFDQGEIRMLLRQPRFDLPGGVKYYADFQIFWSDDTVTHEDVKGVRTPLYIAKKKMVEEIYQIEIIEV